MYKRKSDSLELLDTLEVVHPVDSHGVDQLLSDQLSHRLGAFLAILLGLLDSNNLAVFEGDLGRDFATVRGSLIKLFIELNN